MTSFAEVSEILRDRRFAGRAGRPEGRAFLGDSLVTIDNEEHLARRRMYMPLMAEEFLRGLEESVLAPAVGSVLRQQCGPPEADGFVRGDLVVIARDICMRLAAALIGFDGVNTDQASARLYALLGPLAEGATVEWSTRDHAEVVREGLIAKEQYRAEFFAPAWQRRVDLLEAYRNGRISRAELPTDVLMALLAHWQEHWDDDLPVRESILFLAGATGNPVGQLVYAVEDLFGWFADNPGGRELAGREDLLRRAIAETMRLHVAGTPVLLRECTEDVTLHCSGRRFTAHAIVGLDMVAANHDQGVFGPDADRFDPDREARLPARVKAYGVAFGGGPHICLGRPLVLGRYVEVGIDGLQYHVLRAVLNLGIEPDPAMPPRLAASGQRHYVSFPVRFPAASLLPGIR